MEQDPIELWTSVEKCIANVYQQLVKAGFSKTDIKVIMLLFPFLNVTISFIIVHISLIILFEGKYLPHFFSECNYLSYDYL